MKAADASTTDDAPAGPAAETSSNGSARTPEASAPSPVADQDEPPAVSGPTPPPGNEPPSEFLRDLIAAMRKVADEARQAGVDELKTQAEQTVQALESDAEKRRTELRERAETDISGVGDWARAEAERIKTEAEQRVEARRAQLEQQLAAEAMRTEAEAKALRSRVADYERELEAYHAQLAEINDPAAFAAAAKRMPSPPSLTPGSDAAPASAPAPEPATAVAPAAATAPAPAAPSPEPASEVHPAEEEVLAARLAELDAKVDDAQATVAPADGGAAVTTDVIVKGLGSFGAITGFRQSLANQEGISGVALSLGQTGEFVFRATHAPGFDVAGAIHSLEGDGANVEQRPEGGLRVTLERAR